MDNKVTAKYKNFILISLVIFNTLACLVKIAYDQYSSIDAFRYSWHTNYTVQIKVELVISEEPKHTFDFFKFIAPQEKAAGFTQFNSDFLTLSKYSIKNSNTETIVRLKILNQTSSEHQSLISILHRSNIRHKSSDEEPLQFI